MDKKILYVVLPCYNEEENIRELVKEWQNQKSELGNKNFVLRLVIVNDGSIDNTLNIINNMEKYYDNTGSIQRKNMQRLQYVRRSLPDGDTGS